MTIIKTLDEIKKFLNLKKGTAVLVSYKLKTEDQGVELSYSLDYITTSLTRNEVKNIIDVYNKTLIDKIYKVDTVVSLRDLVTDLNKESPTTVRFYLTNNGQNYPDVHIPKGGYIKKIENLLVER